jgi:hypothetical protein
MGMQNNFFQKNLLYLDSIKKIATFAGEFN